ncbi:MAG: DUF2634 domain-containing protein [Limnochordales bacterium]
MIPQGATLSNAQIVTVEQPSRTWGIDWEAGLVTGMIDGLEAVKQAIHMILQTPRFRYLIYSPNYGHELESLIGKHPLLVRSEAARMVREALLQDDRILAVEDFDVRVNGDNILIAFTVRSRYGSFRAQQEVK